MSAPGSGRGRGTIAVVGGGLGGALAALFLGREGYEVRGYEMRADPRAGGVAGGRSINLALSARGLHALGEAGLAEAVLAEAVPMRGRMIHALDGATRFQPYGTSASQANHSVSRAGLNLLLLEAAERQPNVRFAFGRKCTGCDLESGRPSIQDVASGALERVECDAVVAADGAFSSVRRSLMTLDRFDYDQRYLTHGYKELTIPPGPGGRFRIEKNALHIWPRGGFMMIALPNVDGSFTCTLFAPFAGEQGFDALKSPDAVRRYFASAFPDAVPLLPALEEEFLRNPTGSLVTIRCRPWHHRGRVLLLGDACHAVVPFHGQGANAAFEDCVVLRDSLRRSAPDLEAAFASFERLRKEHADALASLSLANFEEMRDKTASRLFLARTALEKGLHRLFPTWFMPLYMMISFTRIPYADAVRRDRRQKRAAIAAAVGLLAALTAAVLLWIHGAP